MKIGMTGNRDGMSNPQSCRFISIISTLEAECEFHHGDCVGSDAEAWAVACAFGLHTVCHPPAIQNLRAFTENDEQREFASYFERNRAIVDETDILYGFPKTMFETKGGTWYTINYADKQGKHVVIIWPNGTIEERNI